ncbi:MAG: chorismate synthase [Oscillospiraceae bacterium]|nr:chorismate synthase [Oscillospiraceae bacterium]
MPSSFGDNLKITIFGQSHSPAVGVSIDGLPAGLAICLDEIYAFLRRRMPGKNAYSTARREADVPEFLSGLADGITCGAPLTAIIRNTDTRPQDYEQLRDVPRPSHADFSAFAKYGTAHDIRGGGVFSGRMTAPLCIAGGICLQLLRREGIRVAGHITRIGDEHRRGFDPVKIGNDEFDILQNADFPVLDKEAGERMLAAIEAASLAGDSLGGIIECAAIGVPAGLGGPLFGGLDSRLAALLFSIPAVKGVEFGSGFSCAELRGSQNNDAFIIDEGSIKTRTNNHGGILGGITSGMPVIFRAAFKPTPSISRQQDSVSLSRRENVMLTVTGRHDPCIVPRAVPCIEAACAVALYDAFLGMKTMHNS